MNADKSVNLLLVDDSEANLVALEALLGSQEYRLVRATSGEEALRQVLDTDFAAIVMDVMMPTMDGFETARLIKQRERSAHVPIIFLTGMAKDKRFQDLGYETGAVDYLTKPVDEHALKAKLAVFADLFRLRDALQTETLAHQRLRAESAAEHAQMRADLDREQDVMVRRFEARQTTKISGAFHGQQQVRDSVPDAFADLVADFSRCLDMAVDARVHATDHDVSTELQSVASKMAFLGAGPRDVVDVHRAAIAAACKDRPPPKVRVTTDEGRYLLVELMGHLLGLYRTFYNRRVGPLTPSPKALKAMEKAQ